MDEKSIEIKGIGRIAYDLMDENQKAAVAFGMIPKEVMDNVISNIRYRAAQVLSDELGISKDVAYLSVRDEFVKECKRKTALAIFERAKELDKLLV